MLIRAVASQNNGTAVLFRRCRSSISGAVTVTISKAQSDVFQAVPPGFVKAPAHGSYIECGEKRALEVNLGRPVGKLAGGLEGG